MPTLLAGFRNVALARTAAAHFLVAFRMANIGLVLSGGGARAAYQVGAVRALCELLSVKRSPFDIFTGISAGAINSTALASGADDFPRAVQRLTDTWLGLTQASVYRTDIRSLTGLSARWLKDVTTGGMLGRSRANHLLDTAPLRDLLCRRLEIQRLQDHFAAGLLRGAAVSATNYLTGNTLTFYDGAPDLEPWVRNGRIAFREPLCVEHLMASAAIPIFFPPVSLGGRPFGDGGMRMTAPLSPAIHLGARRILAIGIRFLRPPEDSVKRNRELRAESASAAQIGGVLLNALLLDSLDDDVARLERVNRTLGFIPEGIRRGDSDRLRRIPALVLRPSQDLGTLAADEYRRFPLMLRHLLRGIGATGGEGWDLLSYLAFQPGYVGKLIELGYQDTLARRAEIEAFFSRPSEQAPTAAAAFDKKYES
jgi:NTE family protein